MQRGRMTYLLALALAALAHRAPAAQDRPAAPAAPAPAGPAANAPAPCAVAKIVVRVPSGGKYTVYLQDGSTAPQEVTDRAELTPPAGARQATVYVLDPRSGYAARKTVDVAGAPVEVAFAGPDFKLVQKVRVLVTGKEGKPVAGGVVTLTDSARGSSRRILDRSSLGTAEFDMVPSGAGTLTVTPEGGTATTKQVNIDLARGDTAQSIPVALPEVTAVVEPAAGSAPVAPRAPAPAAGTPAAGTPPAAVPPSPPAAVPAVPATQPLPTAPSGGGDLGGTLIGFLFLAALLYGIIAYMKTRGITVEMLIKKLGVQPDAVAVGGGSLAGANTAGAAPAPGTAPAPPPVVADPNQCPFCGQMKAPDGTCACTVTRGAAPGFTGAPAFGGLTGAPAAGARLVGIAGTYLGQVFPLSGTAVIGREPTNGVPLDRDHTASRRHAQISEQGGAYVIQDLGSANGTFVNGARVAEAPLRPGDEIGIGGSRFRFEV